MSATAQTAPERVEDWNRELEPLPASDRVRWALDQFPGQVALSTSFGVQSAVMLHLVKRIDPRIPVVFIDTGYLFPETYLFAEQLTERLGLNLKVYAPTLTPARQEALYGKLWEQGVEGLEKYGRINKVEPEPCLARTRGARLADRTAPRARLDARGIVRGQTTEPRAQGASHH